MKTLILKCTQPCFKQFKFKNIFQKGKVQQFILTS
jgi:hypothetical protein